MRHAAAKRGSRRPGTSKGVVATRVQQGDLKAATTAFQIGNEPVDGIARIGNVRRALWLSINRNQVVAMIDLQAMTREIEQGDAIFG